jgi:signal transduction histidine kinase/CheY-like chemotaxis protein/HPt (histidine-containing phosphotransfer) domain-containing protein
MYELSNFTLKDMTSCAASLRKMGIGAAGMQQAAENIVRFLYENLRNERQERSCGLVRFFKTHAYGDLDDLARQFVDRHFNGDSLLPDTKCLTLLATDGEMPEWTSREKSSGHLAIPLPSSDMLVRFPMIAQLIKQLGLDAGSLLEPDPALLVDLSQRSYNVFYAPEALGSPYFPQQEEFIVKHNIRSVLGFGGMLPTGNLFTTIMFSHDYIPRETAELFRSLSLSVKMAIIPFDDAKDLIHRTQLVTLEQLLTVHEQAVLQQSEKLEAALNDALNASKIKSEFVANISHEVRTPISGVLGMTELLLDTRLDAEQNTLVSSIHDFANTLLTIINDILDFSKLEAGKVELEHIQFSISNLLKSCGDLFEPTARQKGVKFKTFIDPKIPSLVEADLVRLRQIVLNLMANAVKFTERGEVITSARLIGQDDGRLTVRFNVQDTGIGISPEKLEVLFQPFAQADGSTTRKYGGTGLGLSISKRLVELMGGTMATESKLGAGSTFSFDIPLDLPAGPPDSLATDSAKPVAEEQPRRGRVLLAEDNPLLQDLSMRQLRKLGVTATAVANGRDALRAAESGDFALILMDCQMPELDGFKATEAIRQLEANTGRHVPIIAMTAAAMTGDRELCLSAGMDDYIPKPVTIAQLKSALEKWMPPDGATTCSADDTQTQPASADKNTPLDFALLEKNYGAGSVDEILSLFVKEGQELIEALNEQSTAQEVRGLSSTAHQLKGLFAVITADELSDTCLEMEKALKQHDWKTVTELSAQISSGYTSLATFIQNRCAKI